MKKKSVILFSVAAALFVLFVAFTLIVAFCDTRTVAYEGEIEAELGLAGINQSVFSSLGQNELWLEFTELLGIIALGIAFLFALLGAYQLFQRKHLLAVDVQILLLAVFYILVVFFYVLFEVVTVNYRPILVDGALEASYPSSHTMLACAIFVSAPFAVWHLIQSKSMRITVATLGGILAALTAVGRLLSGVHWFTDILGAVLLSASLVILYVAALSLFDKAEKHKH